MLEFVSDAVFYGSVGLIVGWNFLAQPAWVRNLVDKVKAKFSD